MAAKKASVKEKKTCPPGYMWVTASLVPDNVAIAFRARYMTKKIGRMQVLRALVEAYAAGDLDEVVERRVKKMEPMPELSETKWDRYRAKKG